MLVGISPFVRSYSVSKCVHLPKKNFTDALFKEKCQSFRSALLQLFNKNWEKVKKDSGSHFHNVNKSNERKRIGEYINLKNSNILVNNNSIYQIAIGVKKEFRLFGIKRNHANSDLFEILLFDPNHLFHPNLGSGFDEEKGKYPFGEEAICLMDCLGGNKGGECGGLNEKPENEKMIRKKKLGKV